MPLTKDELTALSDNTPEEIKEWLPTLTPEDISALYDLEVAKSEPRNTVVDLLMTETNNESNEPPVEEKAPAIVEGALNKNKPYNMIWHNGLKCILQNDTIYDRVTNKKIEDIK